MKSKPGGDRQSRKRELDRKSQRLARERTKSRMAHLETLVAHFRETDSDARFSSLVDQLSDVVRERDSLKGLLKSLDFAIRSHLDDTAACREMPRNISAQPAQDSPDWGQNNQLAIRHPTTETAQSSESLQEDPFLFDLPPLPTSFIWGQEDATAPQAVLPGCGCLVGTSSDGGNTTHSFWRQLNELWKGLPGTDLSVEDEESEDAVIRAVLDGWDSIGARSQSLATCRFLRRLDELPWMQPNQINRLAMLSLTRLMLVSQSSARKAELPRWLHARPSQILPHSNAIDFVFW
ncbi:hypothetical protein NW764_016454 [Fusarium oxysporum]|nr:hypothetical protein NW764_016454 [Fusarium oxysporum]